MSLKDLKNAASARKQEADAQSQDKPPVRTPPVPAPAVEEGPSTAQVMDGRTKMLGARVPLSIHREWQGHVFRAQDYHPSLTTQDAIPALVRLLRDEEVWVKFMAELDRKA